MLKTLLVIAVVSLILVACNDPFGSTARQQSHDSAVIAQAQSQAQVAEWDARAKGWQAQYKFLGDMTTTLAEAAKPNYRPIYLALLIIGGFGAATLYMQWHTTQAIINGGSMGGQYMINGGTSKMLPKATQYALMQAYQRGDYEQGEDGNHYITLNNRTYKALLLAPAEYDDTE